MSNQSGISISDDLAAEFPAFVESGDVAAILVLDHAKEHVSLQHRVPKAGGFAAVRDKLGEGAEARYIALRLPGPEGGLAFVQFMPDLAPLSSKMKYASSHATIHRELGGSSVFATSIFWTELSEVGDDGLRAHAAHESAPAPLTEEEQSLRTAAELEHAHGSAGRSVAGQSALSIDANVDAAARSKLTSLKSADGDAAVFAVTSADSETISLVAGVPTTNLASELAGLDEPRYAVASLHGKHAFAFVCPRSATIKQRMLFASTRIPFLNYIKEIMEIDAVIETFEPETDLTEAALAAELVPAEQAERAAAGQSRPKFQRPRPPKRK